MDRIILRQKKLLEDINLAILAIEEYIEEYTFESYLKNSMLQDAVERNLEIIGEATNKLLQLNPSIPISDARKIVDTRNLLIHSYDNIEDITVWNIIIRKLPILKQEIIQLLEE